MNRILFVETHVGSGWEYFCGALESHGRVENFREEALVYDSPADLLSLTRLPHKCAHSGAIHMDVITHNHSIGSRAVYGIPYQVFLLREPGGSLPVLAASMSWESAASHYRMRLRRLLSVARGSRRGVVLTHEDVCSGAGFRLVSELLRLRPAVDPGETTSSAGDEVPYRLLVRCRESYARYLYAIRSLGLLSVPEG